MDRRFGGPPLMESAPEENRRDLAESIERATPAPTQHAADRLSPGDAWQQPLTPNRWKFRERHIKTVFYNSDRPQKTLAAFQEWLSKQLGGDRRKASPLAIGRVIDGGLTFARRLAAEIRRAIAFPPRLIYD